jgi:hypothetical protein
MLVTPGPTERQADVKPSGIRILTAAAKVALVVAMIAGSFLVVFALLIVVWLSQINLGP